MYLLMHAAAQARVVSPHELLDLEAHGRLVGALRDHELAELNAALAELADNSTRAAHSAHIEEVRKVAAGEICPWCGSDLVKRNGKYGAFMGCSAYPRCRFTQDL